jgi:hypothetical protein
LAEIQVTVLRDLLNMGCSFETLREDGRVDIRMLCKFLQIEYIHMYPNEVGDHISENIIMTGRSKRGPWRKK